MEPVCAWCEKPHGRRRRANGDITFCCSAKCQDQWARHGRGASMRQIQARIDHLKKQPRGCATVADFLAAGGTIFKEEEMPGRIA